jgi:hypothetical protein
VEEGKIAQLYRPSRDPELVELIAVTGRGQLIIRDIGGGEDGIKTKGDKRV